LKQWNEGYDQLIADIDANLDRPILTDASVAESAVTVFQKKISTINCANFLPSELAKVGLDENSLKLQFAVINYCFQGLHNILDAQLTKVSNHPADKIDQTALAKAMQQLTYIATSANELRCVALLRVSYYNRQKEKSIVVPNIVRRLLFDPNKKAATKEFQIEQTGCDPENRPT